MAKSLLKEKCIQLGRKEFSKETLANYQFSSTLARSEFCDFTLGDMKKFTPVKETWKPLKSSLMTQWAYQTAWMRDYVLEPASWKTPVHHGWCMARERWIPGASCTTQTAPPESPLPAIVCCLTNLGDNPHESRNFLSSLWFFPS